MLRHTNIHLRLNSQPSITYNGRVVVAKLKFLIIKKVTMTSQFRDESTFSSEVRTYWSHSQKTPTCQKSAFCDWQFLQSIRYRYIYIYIYININRVLIVRIIQKSTYLNLTLTIITELPPHYTISPFKFFAFLFFPAGLLFKGYPLHIFPLA